MAYTDHDGLVAVFNGVGSPLTVIETPNGPVFTSRSVCAALKIQDPSNARRRIPNANKVSIAVPTNGGTQKTTCLDIKGVRRLIFSTRTPEATLVAKLLDLEIHHVYAEQSTIPVIQAAFVHLNPIRQYTVGPYRVDLYLEAVNIAVECDENGHLGYDQVNEVDRKTYIEEKLGCTFVRFNPDEVGFNLGAVINHILMMMGGHTDGR